MTHKTETDQIEDHKAEIVKLEEKAAELKRKVSHQEYPKWVPDKSDPTGQRGTVVNSEEEEKKWKNSDLVGVVSADQRRKSEEIRDQYIEKENDHRPLGEPRKETEQEKKAKK